VDGSADDIRPRADKGKQGPLDGWTDGTERVREPTNGHRTTCAICGGQLVGPKQHAKQRCGPHLMRMLA
jgi:hypothetical protein